MSFCGTQALERRMKMRGFGMHCTGLAYTLSTLKNRGIDMTEAGAQYRLFQLDNGQRADFAKFAKTLRLLTEEHTIHDDSYWQLYRDTDYHDYEFMKLLDQFPADEVKQVITTLEKVAGGEIPNEDELKFAHDFLYTLGYRGHGLADDMDGGCF